MSWSLAYSLVPRPSPAPVFDRLQYEAPFLHTASKAIKNWSRRRPGNEDTLAHTYMTMNHNFLMFVLPNTNISCAGVTRDGGLYLMQETQPGT